MELTDDVLINVVDLAKAEFEIEEVAGVFSTLQKVGEDAKIADARAEDIIKTLAEGKDFILKLKFLKKANDSQYFFGEKNESVKVGKERSWEIERINGRKKLVFLWEWMEGFTIWLTHF